MPAARPTSASARARRALPLLGLLAVVALGACERPFVEPRQPLIEVVSPNLDEVLPDSAVVLTLTASSFRAVERVAVDGEPMRFDPARGHWTDTLRLRPGLNRIVVQAYDARDVEGRDTLFALHLPHRFASAPGLPLPVGGHAATLLPDGRVLVTGGAQAVNLPASGFAFMQARDRPDFITLPASLLRARTGHTASLLPDGRVLLLGGSRTESITSVEDFVNQAEIFDPATGRFAGVPLDGAPPGRAWHTTAVLAGSGGETALFVYGGRGNVRPAGEPLLGVRRDARIFLFRNDSLVSVSPGIGGNLESGVDGHVQPPLGTGGTGEPNEYLVAGSYFRTAAEYENVAFRARISGRGFETLAASDDFIPRTRHAGSPLRPGWAALFGGRRAGAATAAPTELYLAEIDRFFRLPAAHDAPLARWAHTATLLPDGGVLLLGGFGTDGAALRTAERMDFNW